jgi:hypothetical protein
MSSGLPEWQARQVVQRMHRLRGQVDLFAIHAQTLRMSPSLDALALLDEAGNLLRDLQANRVDFQDAEARAGKLSRTLSTRPDARTGMAPAAQWSNELRAGGRQFHEAVQRAEREIRGLYDATGERLNSPTRTPTLPTDFVDVLVNFADLLARWVDYRKRRARS